MLVDGQHPQYNTHQHTHNIYIYMYMRVYHFCAHNMFIYECVVFSWCCVVVGVVCGSSLLYYYRLVFMCVYAFMLLHCMCVD